MPWGDRKEEEFAGRKGIQWQRGSFRGGHSTSYREGGKEIRLKREKDMWQRGKRWEWRKAKSAMRKRYGKKNRTARHSGLQGRGGGRLLGDSLVGNKNWGRSAPRPGSFKL